MAASGAASPEDGLDSATVEAAKQQARSGLTRWLMAYVSVLLLVAVGLGLFLNRHLLGLTHKGSAGAGPVLADSVPSPPLAAPPWSYPHGRAVTAPPSYPPLIPRYPPAFTAFDVRSAMVFHTPPPLPSIATFQQSFIRAMAAAADVPEQRVLVHHITNASSVAAAPSSPPSLVVASTVRFEEQQAAEAFAGQLETDGEFLTTIFNSDFALAAFEVSEATPLGTVTVANVTTGDGELVQPPSYPPGYPPHVPLSACALRRFEWLGDGWCDAGVANTAECGWDGGDCCDDNVPLFDCLDPTHHNFGRSAPRGLQLPAPTNPRYTSGGRELSSAELVMNYNNYYEFTTAKTYVAVVAGRHQDFFDGPWSITIDGLVERPMTVDVRELLDLFHMEERVYRHRCVEAWSIVVPWVGFPLYKLLDTVRPLAGAKYVEFQTFFNTSVSEPQRLFSHTYPYPYIEGLTIDEARNELAFLSVGQYQQPLPPQSGAPLRLTVPWKYGFKSVKSLVRISFTDVRPVNFWQSLQASEYGFWANVNPEVAHPRWSQASEKELVDSSAGQRIPTQLFNGYAEQVAYLYTDMEGESLYM